MKSLGLYVHIPFCEKKCNYCDFYSLAGLKSDIEEKYINSLLKEIMQLKNSCNDFVVDTIFIGGGTPSCIKAENIKKILDEIKNNFNVEKDAEITLEANPNSISEEKIEIYKLSGINRISLGIQSLDEDVLKFIGRLHNANDAINAIKNVIKRGIENVNADIMFNIPNQTKKSVLDSIDGVIKAGVKHISFYSLKLEEGTPMYKMNELGKFKMIEDEEEREIYYDGRNLMKNQGFNQYEISNFSLPGYECKHNIRYWTVKDYIGIGTSSHSYFNGIRSMNISDIKYYCDNIDDRNSYHVVNEILSVREKMFEFIMLGMRMNRGIDILEFEKIFKKDFYSEYGEIVYRLNKQKLIDIDNKNIKLSEFGMDVSNYVFEEFME